MLAPWSVSADSATWLRVALCGLAIAAVLAACGDDPTPTPAATFLISQAPPSSVDDYRRLAEEDPAGRESMFESAIAILSGDIAKDSTNVDAYVRRGAVHTAMYVYSGRPPDKDNSKFEQAIEDFTGAIDLDPNNVDAYIGRGYAYELKEEREKANADFQTALGLLKQSYQSRFQRC